MTESTTCVPDFSYWKEAARKNRLIMGSFDEKRVLDEVIELGADFTKELAVMAEAGGIELSVEDFISGRGRKGGLLVMAGHQPVIYHPGILYKTRLLHRASAEFNAVCVNVIIDIDEGDWGRIYYPSAEPFGVKSALLGSGAGPGRYQRVADEKAVKEIFSDIVKNLKRLGLSDSAEKARVAGMLYQNLSGLSLTAANTIVRRVFVPSLSLIEVPFSKILHIPAVSQFMTGLLLKSREFFTVYNLLLERHRLERKIKNKANPFPNLKKNGELFELPFWISGANGRKPLYSGREGDSTVFFCDGKKIGKSASGSECVEFDDGLSVYPRGAVLSLILRLFCCDLFVHGLGGAGYDTFTDKLIKDYIGIEPPLFCKASKTRYLFKEKALETAGAKEKAASLREIYSSAGENLDETFLPQKIKKTLKELNDRRRELIADLSRAAYGEKKSIGAALGEINGRIKEAIDSAFGDRWKKAAAFPPEYERMIYFREYPFFFYCD